MLTSTVIAFVVIYVLEAIVIIVGNVFAIFVFGSQALYLRRTCILLINLAVADLLVGIAEPIVLGTEKFPKMKMAISKTKAVGQDEKSDKNMSSAFQLLASSMSVIFLALISLERVYAVLWPLRHRVTSTRVYIYSIVIVWAVGLCAAGLSVLPMHYKKVRRQYVTVAIHACLFIALLVICASYLKIRTRLRRTNPELDVHNRQVTERNLRFSRTIFLATAVSLLFWLPAFAVYTTRGFCPQCFPPPVVWFVNALHLANSLVNPFVYSFRMPIFKDALKKFSRKRGQNNEIRPSQVGRLAVCWEETLTPKMERTGHTSDINFTCNKITNDNV